MIQSTLKRRSPLKRTGQLKRTKLSPVSAKRRKESAIYSDDRPEFLKKHPFCQLKIAQYGCDEAQVIASKGMGLLPNLIDFVKIPASCDIHHKAGRTGKNYLDESTWMAVSREGHRWIHDHPKEARARGWLA